MSEKVVKVDIDNDRQLRLEALNQATIASIHGSSTSTLQILRRAKEYENYLRDGSLTSEGNDNGRH